MVGIEDYVIQRSPGAAWRSPSNRRAEGYSGHMGSWREEAVKHKPRARRLLDTGREGRASGRNRGGAGMGRPAGRSTGRGHSRGGGRRRARGSRGCRGGTRGQREARAAQARGDAEEAAAVADGRVRMSSDLLPDLRPGLQSLDGTGETEIRRIIADYEARAAADETTWGMSLSSASKRAAVKRHTMRFDVYNSFGLSVEQLEDVVGSQDERRKGSGADLTVFLETAGKEQKLAAAWGSNRMLVADAPMKSDPAAGVAIVLSKRMARAVMSHGQVGSRIKWVMLETTTYPVVVFGVYVPHHGRTCPAMEDTLGELVHLMGTFPERCCKIVMTDANARMSRNIPGITGKWTVHAEGNEAGQKFQQVLEEAELRAVSTYYRQRRRVGGSGTYQAFGRQGNGKKSATIDYIAVSRRFASNCSSVKIQWEPSERRFRKKSGVGVRKDHARLSMKWRMRLRRPLQQQQKAGRLLLQDSAKREEFSGIYRQAIPWRNAPALHTGETMAPAASDNLDEPRQANEIVAAEPEDAAPAGNPRKVTFSQDTDDTARGRHEGRGRKYRRRHEPDEDTWRHRYKRKLALQEQRTTRRLICTDDNRHVALPADRVPGPLGLEELGFTVELYATAEEDATVSTPESAAAPSLLPSAAEADETQAMAETSGPDFMTRMSSLENSGRVTESQDMAYAAFENACRAVMEAHGPDLDLPGATGRHGRFFSLSAETRQRKAELRATAPSESDPDRYEKDRAGWRELNKLIKADQRRWADGMEIALTRADDAGDHPATSALLKVLGRKGGGGAMRQPTRKPDGSPYISVDETLAGWNDYFTGHFGATDRDCERPPLEVLTRNPDVLEADLPRSAFDSGLRRCKKGKATPDGIPAELFQALEECADDLFMQIQARRERPPRYASGGLPNVLQGNQKGLT